MKIAAVCCTYNRHRLLAEAVESFLRQTHPDKEMVILDDAGLYEPGAADHLPGVKLITTRHRFRTLGEKRNATVALASPDVDVFCVWDDDDIYLPHHMAAAAATLQSNGGQDVFECYAIPSTIYIDHPDHLQRKESNGLFHPSWSFTREAFVAVDGYPPMQSGQDQALRRRWAMKHVARRNPITFDSRPSFVYRWATTGDKHLSAMGEGGYERLGSVKHPYRKISRIEPKWSKNWTRLAELEQASTTGGQK
jgi:glycosyltransferase involved in cell wall biosynthesis